MAPPLLSLLLFCLYLLHHPFSCNANLHKTNLFRSEFSHAPSEDTPITTYFEVTKPIELPKTKPCSTLVLQHDFASTYGKPPALAEYKPPENCPSQNFSKIILEWKATSKGRQFDRIFGVWLGGVEILRSCTAEPRATGTIWTVEKDITRYSSVLKNPQTLAVYLGNIVDKTYTGIYHVNLTFHFYPAEEPHNQFKGNSANLVSGFSSPADLVIPISRNLPLNDGLWFLVENSTDVQLKEFKIPENAYRAVLEVYVSFHESDEFWYGNPPNEYIIANNLTGMAGNGPFREVVISVDGTVVGAVWPFTVIYTGGINPLLWRPITGIGSFDLPTYDIEITPFLGKILDGKNHKFGFSVTDALSVWYIDANLHVWIDSQSEKTTAELIKYDSSPLVVSRISDFKGLNGTFITKANRTILSSGWVKSSYGKIKTDSIQEFGFRNTMNFGKNGNLQIVSQTIEASRNVYAKHPSAHLYSVKLSHWFPLYFYIDNVDQGNGTYLTVANVSLGFNEDRFSGARFGFSVSSLKNLQFGQGYILVKGNLVSSGLGSTQQVYTYDGSNECYVRNISSTNYTILYDEQGKTCGRKDCLGSGFWSRRWWSFPARRAFLASDLHGRKGLA